MHIAYIGNFGPEHSTENDVARALENNGHEVHRFQEGEALALEALTAEVRAGNYAFVLWTRTKGLADKVGDTAQYRLLHAAHRPAVPVVGYHLDRWWGLERSKQVWEDPFFQVDLLCTADGGHDDSWDMASVNHAWFPPAISERNCGIGTPRAEYESDIAFVGSWQGGYHREWKHRAELVAWLSRTYGDRVKFWPKHGQPAIRGDDLKDLYASVKVVVGDSCLVPKADSTPMTHYCSDRIPETLGRGGVLVHPHVKGITDLYLYQWEYDLWNWASLKQTIDRIVSDEIFDDESVGYTSRDEYRSLQVQHITERHTYEVRMRHLVNLLTERGML
jgi:hypothetical protein